MGGAGVVVRICGLQYGVRAFIGSGGGGAGSGEHPLVFPVEIYTELSTVSMTAFSLVLPGCA